MYYSQFEISADLARNPYDIHKELWRSFSRTGKEQRDFLFRVQWQKHSRFLSVLVQSQSEPQTISDTKCFLKASKQVNFVLEKGQLLRFALCANPVKRLAKDKNRVPLFGDDSQLDWLERHFQESAQLHEAQVVNSHMLYFHKKNSAEGFHRGKILTVTFDGILEVQDSQLFNEILQSGIGPAKSFGCGLLTLAKA